MQPSFNLLTRPWIPVQMGASLQLVSLEQALTQARWIRTISDPSPAFTLAIHRLLAVMLGRSSQQGLLVYLQTHSSQFDLFDPHYPFLQNPKASGSKQPMGQWASALSGNGKGGLSGAFTPAEAARLLVAQSFLQLERTASKPGMWLLPKAATLWHTLQLMHPELWSQDAPPWENPTQPQFHRFCPSLPLRLVPQHVHQQTLVRWIEKQPTKPTSVAFPPDPQWMPRPPTRQILAFAFWQQASQNPNHPTLLPAAMAINQRHSKSIPLSLNIVGREPNKSWQAVDVHWPLFLQSPPGIAWLQWAFERAHRMAQHLRRALTSLWRTLRPMGVSPKVSIAKVMQSYQAALVESLSTLLQNDWRNREQASRQWLSELVRVSEGLWTLHRPDCGPNPLFLPVLYNAERLLVWGQKEVMGSLA